MRKEITVAICTCGRGQILLSTIDLILAQEVTTSVDVLVIDQHYNHSAEVMNALSALQERGAIRWKRTDCSSLTGKRNVVLREALAEVILFIDDDVLIPPGFVQRHLDYYGKLEISAVTGQVFQAIDPYAPPSLENPGCSSIPHFTADEAMVTRHVIGCNFSVRKSAVCAIGGFDEQFIASSQCEDFDIGERLVDAGYIIWYDPNLWLIHLRFPAGGTRGGKVWPEWTRSANVFMYMFRHAKTPGQWGSLIWRALRTGPLRKQVVQNPAIWAVAWLGLLNGAIYGFHHRKFRLKYDC